MERREQKAVLMSWARDGRLQLRESVGEFDTSNSGRVLGTSAS